MSIELFRAEEVRELIIRTITELSWRHGGIVYDRFQSDYKYLPSPSFSLSFTRRVTA